MTTDSKHQTLARYMEKPRLVAAHMNAAKVYAALSHSNKRKVGAVIVTPGEQTFMGYNGTPPGWDNRCEDGEGSTLPDVVHAEQNALDKITKSTQSSEGSVIFCTMAPCLQCAKRIHGAGIIGVWFEGVGRNSLEGLAFLERAGIFTQPMEQP